MGSKYFKAAEGAYKLGKYVAKKFTKQSKGGVETITGVAPNVPKTAGEKALRTLKVEGEKFKGKITKVGQDISSKVEEFTKKIKKMKTPKKD